MTQRRTSRYLLLLFATTLCLACGKKNPEAGSRSKKKIEGDRKTKQPNDIKEKMGNMNLSEAKEFVNKTKKEVKAKKEALQKATKEVSDATEKLQTEQKSVLEAQTAYLTKAGTLKVSLVEASHKCNLTSKNVSSLDYKKTKKKNLLGDIVKELNRIKESFQDTSKKENTLKVLDFTERMNDGFGKNNTKINSIKVDLQEISIQISELTTGKEKLDKAQKALEKAEEELKTKRDVHKDAMSALETAEKEAEVAQASLIEKAEKKAKE